jgi:branched-chain amino acid transport system ATP-binding protein
MSAIILVADRLSHRFGGIRAVNDVSLALREGEIVALIGPNGAGKTTLVNLMTGVHRPQAGRIEFGGIDVTAQRPFEAARRGLARTFQIVQPFPRMSVVENVAAAALFGGACASVADATARARAQLEFVGLAGSADRPAAALTLAGRKRLELAKSLAMAPKVLMLDEVNAGLNASEIDGALDLIRRIAARGITILIIEHLMKVVLSVAGRVLVLHQGQLIAEGTAAEIVKDDRVVEAYLGQKFARRARAESQTDDTGG